MYAINEILWNTFFIPCVFLCGAILTLRCGFLQFKNFRKTFRYTVGSVFMKSDSSENGTTPFQAASTALASTVGTGNIVGTAQAIAMGGPGAVFWLWVTALFGMIIKYTEIFLSLKFRKKQKDGSCLGGPMYYIEALGKAFIPLAWCYALFASVSAIGMGNMTQINSGVSAVCLAVNQFSHFNENSETWFRLCIGLVLFLLVYKILSGGAKSVGKTAEILVPVMSIAFLVLSIIVLICHAQKLPQALYTIIVSAFTPEAMGGAAAGIGFREAVHWGMRRSAFSNEAGLGSSALAHVAVETNSFAEHSLWGIFEVFVDTILICTAVALVILVSGIPIPWNSSPGPELFKNALATVYGDRLSAIFMSASMFVFAFATVIGWSIYGERCVCYMFGAGAKNAYRLIYCSCIPVGCIMSTSFIWTIADLANVLMSIPNFIALLILSHNKNFYEQKLKS